MISVINLFIIKMLTIFVWFAKFGAITFLSKLGITLEFITAQKNISLQKNLEINHFSHG